jgi:diguanylate cyclase (GGDEF)-like protein
MLDIDHFKQVNDTFGHEAGDAVLRHVAGVLRSASRREDAVCRTGGEEFLIVCPEIGPTEAEQYAERLRRAIHETPYRNGVGPKIVTASIGAATIGPDVKDPEALIRLADQAMYEAKHRGRNRVVLGTPRA